MRTRCIALGTRYWNDTLEGHAVAGNWGAKLPELFFGECPEFCNQPPRHSVCCLEKSSRF